jgi:YHS domain-containing protein
MLLTRRTFATGFVIASFIPLAWATESPSPVPGKRVALRGYDPVGYFIDSRPVQGEPQYWYEFDDTVYLFASAEHRAAFVADPDRYAPQYDGYCAMSVSFGGRDEGLPDVWEIVNDKLYVFGKPNGVQDFDNDRAGTIVRGRANWTATHPK